jgi:hypothetical protein
MYVDEDGLSNVYPIEFEEIERFITEIVYSYRVIVSVIFFTTQAVALYTDIKFNVDD